MNNNSKLKVLLLILMIFIIICIIIVVLFKIKDNNNQEDYDYTIKINNELSELNSDSEYNSGLYYINKYLNCMNSQNEDNYDVLSNIVYYEDLDINNDRDEVYSEIDNQISELQNTVFYVKKAYYKDYDINHSLYIYDGIIAKNDVNQKWTCGILVDYSSNAYFILRGENINNLASFIFDFSINQNEYNIYEFYDFSDAELCDLIYNNFKFMLEYDSKEVFSSLDEEYKQKKFNNNVAKFNNYVSELKDRVEDTTIIYYEKTIEDNKIKYLMKNTKEEEFIFIENKPYQYSIILDRETIDDSFDGK